MSLNILIRTCSIWIFLVLFSLWLGGVASFAQAASATPVLVLTVNGGASAAIVNDEPIELGWYVDGPVTNCSVIQDNSVSGQTTIVTIDTTTLPTSGTRMVTPPPNSTTNFTLSCDGLVDTVPVNTQPPVVTLTSDQGIDLVNSQLLGHVDNLVIRWSSVNATRCSYITRTSPTIGMITETSSSDYSNPRGTSGWIRYDGDPRSIKETTTFSVTCYNDNTGAEETKTLTVNVSNPPPPDAPIVNMGSPDYPAVTRDLLYGYAWVDVWFNSANVTWCVERAYYADGTQYSNPPNWGTGSWVLSRNFTNIQIATTTTFEVECGRGEVTIDSVTYPATSTKKQLTIEVLMPGGTVGEDVTNWDRSTLPPVTAGITADPNPTTKNALTGYARTNATIERQNASYCFLKAHQFSATTGSYTNEFSLSNWTRTLSGNGTSTFAVDLATTTRLVADCWRDYDRLYGSAEEIENGHEIVDLLVTVQEPAETAPPPVVYLYGNATKLTASSMWNTATERIGFNGLAGSPLYLENSTPGATTNRIRFPFVHPFGASGEYDIHLKLCDENDGESTFRVYTEKAGLVGEYVTNDANSPHSYCGSTYGTVFYERLAQAIQLEHGEIITIECDTPDDGERCRLEEILFGGVGVSVTPQVNPVVTSVNVPLLWLSDNTTSCYNFVATRNNGTTYTWSGSSAVRAFETENIATSTSFSITCRRTGDSLTDASVAQVYVPYSATLSTSALAGSGQCIDGSTLQAITAPPGFGPDINGICTPLVDLAAVSPSVSLASAVTNNVDGTYDLPVLIAIQNVLYGGGGAALPENSGISYKANMTIMPEHGLPPVETSVGYFNGGLDAPTAADQPVQSGVLTRNFDDVPFGTHELCARVNRDGSPNYAEANPDPANNTQCTTINLPVPEPPMTIDADRKLIRQDQSVTIDWRVHVTYQLLCSVRGPGGLNVSFDTSVPPERAHPHAEPGHSGTFTTTPLTSTGVFELECTEPITNTTFTKEVRIEMVPDVQEI